MAKATIELSDSLPVNAAHAVTATGNVAIAMRLEGLVDVEKECAKFRSELASLEKQLTGLEGRLSNEKFTSKAPADVVAAERAKLAEWTTRRQQLRDKVQTLCGG